MSASGLKVYSGEPGPMLDCQIENAGGGRAAVIRHPLTIADRLQPR